MKLRMRYWRRKRTVEIRLTFRRRAFLYLKPRLILIVLIGFDDIGPSHQSKHIIEREMSNPNLNPINEGGANLIS